MIRLVIDVGNTNHKIAVFDEQELLAFERLPHVNEDFVADWIAKYKVSHSALLNVGIASEKLIKMLKTKTTFVPFGVFVEAGIDNKYETPETLGLDRWAKIIAVSNKSNFKHCLIIDSGTCITYDFLNQDKVYLGGSISPGIQMRFKALNTFTDKLPFIQWTEAVGIPEGTNTRNAIISGILNGILNEIKGYIEEYSNKCKGLRILLTGGDSEFLSHQLKNSIFAPRIERDPLLVLKGLNEVITLETCI